MAKDKVVYLLPCTDIAVEEAERLSTTAATTTTTTTESAIMPDRCYGGGSAILPVRELAMMSFMDQLTEKPDWHKKIFDDKIQFWHLAIRAKYQRWDEQKKLTLVDDNTIWGTPDYVPLEGIMNENTFRCCIEELQNKAKYYEKTGIIPTLDACASVAKSDTLIPATLRERLRTAFGALKADQASAPDWHPRTDDMVQDLVHPSMYPLVYGRSRVFRQEVVGVDDAIEKWAGKGELIEREGSSTAEDRSVYGVYSRAFQWPPSNVAFQDDDSVKMTSYVNGLHPNKFADVYGTLEKLIEAALPAWDQCLALAVGYQSKKDGAGRTESRFPYPMAPDDENEDNRDRTFLDCEDEHVDSGEGPWTFNLEYDDETRAKKLLRRPVMPESVFQDTKYAPEPGKRLVDRFRESGLQVIIKMASIELTPQKPDFPVGGWHVEGQMNEHICGTALYYLDSENVTPSDLSFRMQTSAYLSEDIIVGQDYGSVETKEGRLLAFPNVFQHRVSPFRLADPTKPGHRRFIALWLVDPTKRVMSTAKVPPQQMSWWLEAALGSGKSASSVLEGLPAEILMLMKDSGVDVAAAAVAGKDGGKLPQELMDMVRGYFHAESGALPMSLAEAKQHRLELMEERSAFMQKSGPDWEEASYGFCEH
ncbi:hypothetical protein F5Y15DRAFT_408961 [Xylariaceae sp. FL0016]|nr:hypothetical protein F5Y15DRAFT_408961 [Xylariaceae sp. FL0016]